MAKTILSLLVGLLAASSAPPLLADAAGGASLTYETFLDLVVARHPERALDEKSLARAQEGERRAGLLPDPQFSVGRALVPLPSRYQKVEVENMDRDQAQTTYSLSQAFPWPGTLASEERAARESVAAVQVDTRLAALQRRFEAAELYLRLVRTAKVIEIGRANLVIADAIRDFAHEKFKQGLGSHMQFLNTHSEAAVLKANLASLELTLLNLKRHALLLIDDVTAKAPGSVAFTLAWPSSLVGSSKPTRETAVDLARERIIHLKDAELSRQKAQYRRSLPSFMASGMLMQGDAGMRMYQGTLGVSLPLYSHIQRRSLDSESALVAGRADDELTWHERKKTLALAQAESRIVQLEANLKALAEEIIPPVKEHIESATTEFSQGKTDLTSIIDGRRSLLNLQTTEVNTTEALALARLSVVKIKAGFVDDQLDQDVPQLVGPEASGMSRSDESGSMSGMQGASGTKSSKPMKNGTASRRQPTGIGMDNPDDEGAKAGQKSGMGM